MGPPYMGPPSGFPKDARSRGGGRGPQGRGALLRVCSRDLVLPIPLLTVRLRM